MTISPVKESSGVVTLTLKSKGKALASKVQIISVETHQDINAIPHALITLEDGDMPNQNFPMSESDQLKPGADLDIYVGYASDEWLIFSGFVSKLTISVSGNNQSILQLTLKDRAQAMAFSRKNSHFSQQKDSEIWKKILSSYTDINADIESTSTEHAHLSQFNSSDWDFILARAEANGYLVITHNGKLSISPPKVSETEILKVGYGGDLISFSASLNSDYQCDTVLASAWDIKQQKIVSHTAAAVPLNKQGDITSKELAKASANSEFRLQAPHAMESAALKTWAAAQQVKSSLARIRGEMSFQGSEKAKAGSIIEVSGVGKRFNGSVYVSQVSHTIRAGQWITNVTFGMSAKWSAEHRDLTAPGAAGLLPPVEGLQVGKVLKLHDDPLKQHRIQVDVPAMEVDPPGIWARLANLYASQSCGAFFTPEVGDEVILGYFNNNPSEPVILGSLYSSGRVPPHAVTEKNDIKGIVTRSDLKLEFNEEDKVISLLTPSGHQLILNDKEKSVSIKDSHSNQVLLSEKGIEFKSSNDITLTAKGGIKLSANNKVECTSKGDISMQGANIKLTAKMAFEAKGNASAKFVSSGQAVLQGAMVKIN